MNPRNDIPYTSDPFYRQPDRLKVIHYVIEYFGSIGAMRCELGVSPQVVNAWKNRGVSAKYAVKLERATDGYVTKEQLRPDIFEPDTA